MKRAALADGPWNLATGLASAFVGVDRFGARAGILAAGVLVAVDEFDHRERSIVAMAVAGLQDARIAAGAGLVARRQRLEELLGLRLIAHAREDEAARAEVALLGQRHEALDD